VQRGTRRISKRRREAETRYRPGDQGIVSGRVVSMTWITFIQRRCRFSAGSLRRSWLFREVFRLNPTPLTTSMPATGATASRLRNLQGEAGADHSVQVNAFELLDRIGRLEQTFLKPRPQQLR
jgi:hypothetical protein